MDHHAAETHSAALKQAYSRGYIVGIKDMIAYMKLPDERYTKELEEGNPFKWLGDFLKKKFGKGNSHD